MDNPQWEEVEPRLQKALIQLSNETIVFERLMYKSSNQHRRCIYFRRLCQVRRDLRLLKSARPTELIRISSDCLKNTSPLAHFINNNTKSKKDELQDLPRRVHGMARLLEQMSKPILAASSQIAGLLGQTFFMPFAITFLSMLARIRVLAHQLLHDFVFLYNLLSDCPTMNHLGNYKDLPNSVLSKWDGDNLTVATAFISDQKIGGNDDVQWFIEDRSGQSQGLAKDNATVNNVIFNRDYGEIMEKSESSNDALEPDSMMDEMNECIHDTEGSPGQELEHTEHDRTAYISVSKTPVSGQETVTCSIEDPQPNKQKKDALFDMLLGIQDSFKDTLS